MSKRPWVWPLLVLFLWSGVLASGCAGPSFEQYYSGTWLFREHEVRYLERSQGIQGEFEGLFFLASGTLGGSFGTETMIMFSWDREPGVHFITTLPASRFEIHVDETKEIPTVEFRFKERSGRRHPTCHPNRGELEKANPNNYLMNPEDRLTAPHWSCLSLHYFGGLDTVIVRISAETLEKEIYLPK